MSKILIKVNSSNLSPNFISDVRKTTGLGMSDIISSIKNDAVLKTYTLYENNHEEVEYELLKLLHEVRRAGATIKIYEFLHDEEVAPEELDSHEITEEVLRNMLHSWHEEVNRQENLFGSSINEEPIDVVDKHSDKGFIN